ncbi:MAG: BrnA antitoxin family protein [Pseudomonadota bacterium]|nr:BrnA antitoxin family protein [Pseudomonadota bacterium]MDP1905860.1 BrnA antitoxin family protein [Pseudomonadota bacterium]MDP2351732.1 BrnA antitoxin family protein [Pseudomonadota bacterium]
MNAKLPVTTSTWVDPDDAPELTEEWIEKGTYRIGGKVVSPEEGKAAFREMLRRGRPKAETVKESLTVRYDADIVAAFRSSGPGWQTRMNAALREWLETHTPA